MSESFSTRIRILKIFFTLIFLIFAGRLFYLQILQYQKYFDMAKEQHEKRSVLPAQRGKILVRKNADINDFTPLATNNTLKMLFVDPILLAYPKYNPKMDFSQQEKGNPVLAAQLLAPLFIHSHCEEIEGCTIEIDPEKWNDAERTSVSLYEKELEKIFTEIERHRVILISNLAPSRAEEVAQLHLSGVFFDGPNLVADPTQILSVSDTAAKLSPFLNIPKADLEDYLSRSPKRYVEIVHKIVPEISDKITELKQKPEYASILRGVQMRDEQWRYYPEKTLASQVLGFVDDSGHGQYGIEGRFDQELAGQEGVIYGATSAMGKQILRDNLQIKQARDGADIVLTIDRVIQGEVEKILEEDTKKYDADSGQVLVLEPKTGRILAMANYPTFDPNEYKKVFSRYEISPDQEMQDLDDPIFNQRIPTIQEDGHFYRYFNTWGPLVFRNKVITDEYEPGSVMKAVTMVSAINANEVTPETTYNDTGPVTVDEFKIGNADKIYAGITTMETVILRSLNTGIAFVTRKMGAKLLYSYFKDFGFGQYTFIDLDGEAQGSLPYWTNWTESELVTRGFGQGIPVTMLQMAMAFSSIANGGYLMKPVLIDEIHYSDGTLKKFLPEKVRRVISEQAAETMKNILLKNATYGGASLGKVDGHTVMAKTGTSQTYKNGKTLEGIGTTIASYSGFGPYKDPAFYVLVKFDYPKASQWGAETAALSFRRIAEFLFQYLNIPPDRPFTKNRKDL